jgi:uncharacterized membrane protein
MVKASSPRYEAFSYGWDKTIDNFEYLIRTYILYVLFLIIPGIFFILTIVCAVKGYYPLVVVFGIIMLITGAVIAMSFYIGYLKVALLVCDEEQIRVADLMPTVDEFLRVVQVVILYLAIVGVGLLLFIIPGIIWSIKYYACTWIVLDEGKRPVEALRKSADMTRGLIWELFIFGLQSVFLLVLGVLLCLICITATAPTVLFAATYVYRVMVERASAD